MKKDKEIKTTNIDKQKQYNSSFLFDKELIEKAMITDKPHYAIGIDTSDKDNLAYCLTRKIGDTIEVLLCKISRKETEFRQEVENLAKYFEADIFESKKR